MPLAGRNSVTDRRRRRLDAVELALAALPRRPDKAHRDQIKALAALAAAHPTNSHVALALGSAIAGPDWLEPLDALHQLELLLTADIAAET